jgi:hypothetical protein
MDWERISKTDVRDLVEFESRVNEVWDRNDDVVICSYQLDRFGANVIVDLMRTHPIIIIGGTLQVNPFFVPPQQFLKDYRERAKDLRAESMVA